MKDEILKLKDEEGNIHEYIVLLVFKWYRTNKYYIVYTDNKNSLNDEYDVYANIFDPNDMSVFEEITNDFEWDEISKRLDEMRVEHNDI